MAAHANILFLAVILGVVFAQTSGEVQLITKPEPGQEYVFLQTSAAGSRPVERKEKPSEDERVFETAHKLPPSLTFALQKAQAEEGVIQKTDKSGKNTKNVKSKREAPAVAPAGAIKLDVSALLAKYEPLLKTSTTTTAKPKTTKASVRSTRKPRLNPLIGNKRSKKEVHDESIVATTAGSVLTTSGAGLRAVERDDDVTLVASGSEKQRSRIQIKKGPNGQEYEYEYVYYYYDDDDDKKTTKGSNAHDGPARNEITPKSTPSRGGSRGEGKVTPEPAANEVVPTARGRTRGRQLEDEDVADERLPANTRFPPRSRNLNTTPSNVEVEPEEVKPRGRGRGRPEAQPVSSSENNSDSVSDETQGSRGRTRANVRRPSLELVDSASFNTHTSSGEPPNGGPTFPADLPAGPVRFLGATPNERIDLPEEKKEIEVAASPSSVDAALPDEPTTIMSAMDKVALDLYAVVQGTQRLSGEEAEESTEMVTEADVVETTTVEITTEVPTTEAPTTPTTTTTTTTTTTPAPTTAAPEPAFGRGKYRTRLGGAGGRKVTTTTTTEAPASSDGKPKSRFGRPSFGSRPRARPAAPVAETEETKETKEDAKPVSATRSRARFGASRRVTTVAPTEEASESKATVTSKPAQRPRPTFSLRGRTRPTPAPEAESPPTEETHEASTTVRSRPRLNGANVRPLRPGPRINLSGGRGRLGVTTAAPAETPAESPAPVVEEEEKPQAEEEVKEPEVTPAPDTSPLSRLRNRQRTPLQVRPAAPKTAASAPVQVRRANPLLARRKPIGEPSTTEAPAVESPATEDAADAEEPATEAAPSSTTTEEPKGLNRLLAGRRRLALRQPGTAA